MIDSSTIAASPMWSGTARFTQKQGQYLAFISVYARMFRQAPAEA